MPAKAPKSKAVQDLPRPSDPNKRLPYELGPQRGQGPGETLTPPGVRTLVQGLTKRHKLPKGR